MSMDNLLLIMNIGSTSTKVAIYKNMECLHQETYRHDNDAEFRSFNDIWEQYDFRKNVIKEYVSKCNYKLSDFNCIVSRGAVVKPMNSGAYMINEAMINDAKSRQYGNHPCGVGCAIAFDLAKELNILALTVDAPCVDELIPVSRYTGWKDVYRKSFYQALNQKAIGRKLASTLDKNYNDMNAVIVHMGGGMSIAAHHKGRVEDVNNGLDGDGPMAPERAGTLPAGVVLKYAFSGEYTYEQLYRMINGKGGLYQLLGTTECRDIEQMIANGDKNAKEIYDAMIYQIAKSIGSASVTLKGEVDAIAFTGGLAYSEYIVKKLSEWCGFIAPIYSFPGENEIESLVEGALFAIDGEWPIQNYEDETVLEEVSA